MQALHLCYETQNMTNTIQGTACQKNTPAMQTDGLGHSLNFWGGKGRDQLPGGLGTSSHKISSNGATEKETQAKTTEGCAHLSSFRQRRHKTCRGHTTTKGDKGGKQQRMPREHNTTRFLRLKKRRSLHLGPIRPAHQRQESRRRERGEGASHCRRSPPAGPKKTSTRRRRRAALQSPLCFPSFLSPSFPQGFCCVSSRHPV